jgi:ketosteroid isomerase-like protein
MDSPTLDSPTLDSLDREPDLPEVQAIREAFRAFNDGGVGSGIEALLRISHENCRLRPPSAEGRVLLGHDEARAFFSEATASGKSLSVHPRTFEAHGDEVVVSGSMRVARPGSGFAESQVRWVYRFRDGLVEEASWGPRHSA